MVVFRILSKRFDLPERKPVLRLQTVIEPVIDVGVTKEATEGGEPKREILSGKDCWMVRLGPVLVDIAQSWVGDSQEGIFRLSKCGISGDSLVEDGRELSLGRFSLLRRSALAEPDDQILESIQGSPSSCIYRRANRIAALPEN